MLLVFLAGAAGGVGTAERDYRFSPTDPPWAQSMLPALDSPYAAPWSPSALAGRAAMAIALGRRTALRDLAAVASAAAVTVLGLCLLGSGLPLLPVLIAMIGMAAGSTFWWRGVSWTSDALAPAFVLCAAWAGWRWTVTGRPVLGGAAGVAAALAIVEDPAWLACLPAAVLFLWQRGTARAHRVAMLAASAMVGACAIWPILARTAVARRASWAALSGVEPPGPFALSTALVDIHLPSLGSLPADLSREFTPLGTALLIIGTVALWSARDRRRGLAALATGLIGWHWFVPHSDLESVSLPVAVSGWAAVVVGLHWVQQAIRPRTGPALVILLGLVIAAEPLATRARLGALGRDRQSEQQAKMAYDFKVSDLPAGAAIVAESRRVDAALLLSSQRAGTPAAIVPQHLASLEAVVNRGRPLFAFSNGRANLAPFGFLFERSMAGAVEVAAIVGRATCADLTPGEWADVSLLLATGSFIVHGAGPGTAPGGVILRLTDAQPVLFATIEPRSIPYSLEAATAGTSTLRIPETGRQSPVTFTFVSAPQSAVATAERDSPVMICPGVQNGDATLGRDPAATAALPMTSVTAFGSGWHSAEADPDPFRWTSAAQSSIRITVAPPGPIRVTITATPAARSAQEPAIALAVNACRFPEQPMPPGQGDYEWEVPSHCWRPGPNQLWVGVTPLVSPATLTGSPDTRLLGARVGAVRFERMARMATDQNAK